MKTGDKVRFVDKNSNFGAWDYDGVKDDIDDEGIFVKANLPQVSTIRVRLGENYSIGDIDTTVEIVYRNETFELVEVTT